MPRCVKHPSAELLKGHDYCFICQDGGPSIEADQRSNDYEQMAQHVTPGITGIRTKGQYQRLLKRHGLTDDIPYKEIIKCAKDTGKRERIQEAGIKRIVDGMGERMRHVQHQAPRTQAQHQLMNNLTQHLRQ